MQANKFAILEERGNLAHAYLYYGDFSKYKKYFIDSLSKINIDLNSAGHFLHEEESFGVPDARKLIDWYNSNQTSNNDDYTVCIIASSTIKKDAQQMLLKVLEEAKNPYLFFIFAKPGTEIIETVASRTQNINLSYIEDSEIVNLTKLSIGEKIKKVAANTKGMESAEIRDYTESLVTGLMFYFYQNKDLESTNKVKKLLKVQKALNESYIAPKFILDYIITVV